MSAVKIMLVHDDVPFVQMMTKRLNRRGLNVLAISTGHQALEELAGDSGIDVVILESTVKDTDGVSILSKIKSEYPLVEVIILTGSPELESAIEAIKLGAYDYVGKPLDMENLIAKIASAAKKKATHQEKILEARLRELIERSDT